MFYEMAEEAKPGDGGPGTKEAEAFVDALNHSAERVQTLWFSFLTFMLYLAIATGTTTHRMLFLEEPLNLPVLNIKLPLLGFYILTPIIFVVFHFYMLLNLVLLARTADGFKKALECAFHNDDKASETFRMRIENALFVQLLVGARREREGINAKLLSAMSLITLALAPVVLLLMFEIAFLPYHSEWITWWHRGLLLVDLALVWTLWPGYRSGWGVRLWPQRTWWLALPGVLSAVALVYAVMVATFPDERIYLATNWLHGTSHWDLSTWDFSTNLLKSAGKRNRYGWIAPVNTLDLHGEDLIDDARLKQIIKKNERSAGVRIDIFVRLPQRWVATLGLAGRDLTESNFGSADVRHVDFSGAILNRASCVFAWADNAHFNGAQLQGAVLVGAQLQHASLVGARLQRAVLSAAQLQGSVLDRAQLQGASLDSAQLQGASLKDAQLQGASLAGAQLQGVELHNAQLQGASLDSAELQATQLTGAQLQGASLDHAQLQGAWLSGTQLQGASLKSAQLQATWLNGVQLQGASLDGTQLQGAWLSGAQLQGASLDNTQLQGAWFERAQLQGASLKNAQLHGVWLENVFVWRADAREADWKDARVANPEPDQKYSCENGEGAICDWTADAFEKFKKLIAEQIPEGEKRRLAMEKIEKRLDPNEAQDGEKEMARDWADRERASRDQRVSRESAAQQWMTSVAELWLKAGCAPKGAPYVVRALLARTDELLFPSSAPEVRKVATAFLDKDCAGARGLLEDEIARLKEIRDRTPLPAPKP
ncbi:MAG: pentapeptide repeat-containing protein [Methylocella sp.]